MSKSVTLGGDRLGAGNRLKQRLHNYGRSNHNLSTARITSMAPGVLYPIYTNVGLTGDTFDIDINAFMRTLPTEGPMFGAFKLQVDVFTADLRLYQAILHNNTTEIGFDMDKVLLPKIQLSGYAEQKTKKGGFSKSSLMYYLGMAGMGRKTIGNGIVTRKINATPVLAYYDIFKNYYANKQEENAYAIGTKLEREFVTPECDTISNCIMYQDNPQCTNLSKSTQTIDANKSKIFIISSNFSLKPNENYLSLKGPNMDKAEIIDISKGGTDIKLNFGVWRNNENELQLTYQGTDTISFSPGSLQIRIKQKTLISEEFKEVGINAFPLKNIDNMRKRLLTKWDLNEEVVLGGENNETEELPYSLLLGTQEKDGFEYSKNAQPMQGLVVKTYQSDMFNNWLDNEYIEKVTARSKVQVTNGSFSMDALNFAKKMYDHYNRIAITGGTYDGWQLATYGVESFGKCEKPIYHGGMSSEVIFDEVISTVVGNNDGEVQPLGSLGGRGALKGSRGGKVTVKCREECVIMVIASLTPRVTYSQGNAWYLTELQSIDDLHKPEFDRIGFQDLMIENMAWWDTKINNDGTLVRASLGKQPAWLQYQTDVDRCYGDFAEEDGKGYMVLQRLYDINEEGEVADLTTYIDPMKYNYAFAVQSLTAQNFWGFFNFNIKARRLMSAKQIPNV